MFATFGEFRGKHDRRRMEVNAEKFVDGLGPVSEIG